jgi:hypothetical protein
VDAGESGQYESVRRLKSVSDDAPCERCPRKRLLHGTEFVVDILDAEVIKRLLAGLEKRLHIEFQVKETTESYTRLVTHALDKYACQRVDLFIDGFRWRAGDVEFF